MEGELEKEYKLLAVVFLLVVVVMALYIAYGTNLARVLPESPTFAGERAVP